MAKPFERLEREVLVTNPWHRYCKDRYVRRDGSEGWYFYVDIAGSAGIVPLWADGTVSLIRVRRYLLGTRLWEFPIGGMKDGEAAVDVARKELAEEAGLAAGRLEPLGSFSPYKGASNEVCHFFVAVDLAEVGQELEPSEDIEVHRLPWAEARARLLDQPLGDGQSMSGMLLFERWLARTGRALPGA